MVYVLTRLQDGKEWCSTSVRALAGLMNVKPNAVYNQFKERGFYKSGLFWLREPELIISGRNGKKNGKIESLRPNMGNVGQQFTDNKPKKSDLHYIPDEF